MHTLTTAPTGDAHQSGDGSALPIDPSLARSAVWWFIAVVGGLGLAIAACLPAVVRSYLATFGPPEIVLCAAGAVVAVAAAVRLRLLTRGVGTVAAIEAGLRGPTAYLIGMLVGIPLTRFTGQLVVDTDSARLIAAVRHAERYGYVQLRETQEALIPHLLLRPALALGGLPATRLVPIILTMLLTGLISMSLWRWTRSVVAATAAAVILAFTGVTLDQVWRLPLYPGMLAAGYAAVYWTVTAAGSTGRRRLLLGAAAGVAVALAPEFQTVGQLFYVAPALALIACRPLQLRLGAWIYATAVVATLPRIAINYSIDGTKYIRSGRVEWMVQQGYLASINDTLRNTPTRTGYLTRGPEILSQALGASGWGGWVILGFAVLALAVVPWRVRIASVLAFCVVLGGMVVQRPGPFPRYFEPIIPGIAMLLGLLFARLVARRVWWSWLGATAIAATIAITGGMAYHDKLGTVRNTEDDRAVGRFQLMADIIGDQSVFGVRATKLIGYNADIDVWGPSFVTEKEFVHYLRFDEQRLLKMLDKYGIEYVAVTDGVDNEKTYHEIWTIPRYDFSPVHRMALYRSPNFCPVWRSLPKALYKVGPCEPGERFMYNDNPDEMAAAEQAGGGAPGGGDDAGADPAG